MGSAREAVGLAGLPAGASPDNPSRLTRPSDSRQTQAIVGQGDRRVGGLVSRHLPSRNSGNRVTWSTITANLFRMDRGRVEAES